MKIFEEEINTEKLKKPIISLLTIIAVLVLAINSCSTIRQRERGVEYVFGKVNGEVIKPGLKFHAPFIAKIQKYSIAPKTFEATFAVGKDGAITRDMQTVGTTVNVKYAYDEARIMDIATRYGDSVIESAMKSNIIASVKEVVGGYSIYELVEKQPEVTNRVSESILARMVDYPITISQTTITNWDWSDDFDRQIKETANRTQQVKQAEADGIAYYNAKVAQNMTVQQQQWKHEEQMAYYEKWNGILVPQYVPLTAAGGIVTLPAK